MVEESVFQSERQAEGKIATDDHFATSVYPRYNGRVTAVLVRDGDYVKQGQPLFRMDSTDLVQAQNDVVVGPPAGHPRRRQRGRTSIFFSTAVIIAAFVPLFGLGGIEGHIFSPMAKTYVYALLSAVIATFTVSPALSALLLPANLDENNTLVMRLLHAAYEPFLRFSIANRILTLGAGVLLVLLSELAGRSLQLEFPPKLEEGNMWIRATMPAAISLEEGNGYVNRMRAVMRSFPEVVTVVSQHGRPHDGTDTAGFYNAEFYVPLKPPSDWPKGVTRRRQAAGRISWGRLQRLAEYRGQCRGSRILKGQNSVKLFGSDLKQMEATAKKIK
jgi:heavy metal efflux system protein